MSTKYTPKNTPKPKTRTLRLDPGLDKIIVAAAEKANMSVNLYISNNLALTHVPSLNFQETASLNFSNSYNSSSFDYLSSIKTINENYSEIIELLSGKENDADS